MTKKELIHRICRECGSARLKRPASKLASRRALRMRRPGSRKALRRAG